MSTNRYPSKYLLYVCNTDVPIGYYGQKWKYFFVEEHIHRTLAVALEISSYSPGFLPCPRGKEWGYLSPRKCAAVGKCMHSIKEDYVWKETAIQALANSEYFDRGGATSTIEKISKFFDEKVYTLQEVFFRAHGIHIMPWTGEEQVVYVINICYPSTFHEKYKAQQWAKGSKGIDLNLLIDPSTKPDDWLETGWDTPLKLVNEP